MVFCFKRCMALVGRSKQTGQTIFRLVVKQFIRCWHWSFGAKVYRLRTPRLRGPLLYLDCPNVTAIIINFATISLS